MGHAQVVVAGWFQFLALMSDRVEGRLKRCRDITETLIFYGLPNTPPPPIELTPLRTSAPALMNGRENECFRCFVFVFSGMVGDGVGFE